MFFSHERQQLQHVSWQAAICRTKLREAECLCALISACQATEASVRLTAEKTLTFHQTLLSLKGFCPSHQTTLSLLYLAEETPSWCLCLPSWQPIANFYQHYPLIIMFRGWILLLDSHQDIWPSFVFSSLIADMWTRLEETLLQCDLASA